MLCNVAQQYSEVMVRDSEFELYILTAAGGHSGCQLDQDPGFRPCQLKPDFNMEGQG